MLPSGPTLPRLKTELLFGRDWNLCPSSFAIFQCKDQNLRRIILPFLTLIKRLRKTAVWPSRMPEIV